MKLHLTGRKTVFLFPTTPYVVIMAWLGSSECQLRTLRSSVSPSGFSSTSISFYWLFDLCWNSQEEIKEVCPYIWDNLFSSILPLENVYREICIRKLLFHSYVSPAANMSSCKISQALLLNYDVSRKLCFLPVFLQCDLNFCLHCQMLTVLY